MMLIILVGLLLAQLLNRAIHSYQHLLQVEQSSQVNTAQRIADIIHLMSILSPESRQTIAEQFHDPYIQVKWLAKPIQNSKVGEHKNPRIKRFASILNGFLNTKPPINKLLITEDSSKVFLLYAQLFDNSTLALTIHLTTEAENEDNSSVFFHIVIGQLTVVLFSFFAVHWITRPLENLAQAAEELGKDIHQKPLDENGPIEVSQAARAFNKMQASLVRHIEERTQLLAAISHDLKTPITRLRLRTELLDDSDTRARFQKDLDDMEYMVTVTLDYMRGVNQQEAFQPVDLMALLESLQADAQEVNAEVIIRGTIHSAYKGKPSALKRCISNLIDNAIKYGHCAIITVTENAECCVISILDEGQGLADNQLDKVFTPYYRVESSRNRDSGGTGLGLSIAQDIALAHGGSLVLANSQTGGLEAVLTLPKSTNQARVT
jgi:signal transduction histidine kinase